MGFPQLWDTPDPTEASAGLGLWGCFVLGRNVNKWLRPRRKKSGDVSVLNLPSTTYFTEDLKCTFGLIWVFKWKPSSAMFCFLIWEQTVCFPVTSPWESLLSLPCFDRLFVQSSAFTFLNRNLIPRYRKIDSLGLCKANPTDPAGRNSGIRDGPLLLQR